ncbi:MAG TPA: DUF3034 family protein [Terracidiphilus sp.]
MELRNLHKAIVCGIVGVALLTASHLKAQNLTLEGQTGGFITPTAYVVYSAKGQFFSYPAVGYHFVNTSKVIGDIHTFSIAEGFANRAEVSYTRSVHQEGNSPLFSSLWHFAGMNIFSGKVVAIRDGQGSPLVPGLAAGVIVRTGDHFVTGALDGSTYTNEDVYAAITKTWAHKPVPFLANFGWKATNASIFGIGGQSTRFGGRVFGGLGIPLPGPLKTAIVPAVGFTQEPSQVKNLGSLLVGGRAHIPTTLDYAVRVTQRENPHFAFDIGVGQVAGEIGTTYVAPVGFIPVNLEARKIVGMGLSLRY